MESIISRKDLSKKLTKKEPITITFRFLNEELLITFNTILARFLSMTDHIFLLNSLITVLREVIVNALKANAKRVYFLKMGYDINTQSDYNQGILKFKNNVIGDFDQIKNDLVKSDFFVSTTFELKDDKLMIEVKNNAAILPEEMKRITFRIDRAKLYNDFTEAYEEIEDNTEGAGLGIVLTVLFLKNMGVNPDLFKIQTDGKDTKAVIIIPSQLKPVDIVTKIKQKIISDIEGIPTFPENIIELQRLCNNPESTIDMISKKVMLDPALTSDVIKLSNSAGFFPSRRIENLNTAIMTIGLKNLNAILVTSNARRILNDRYRSYEQIWEHCNKVAFYSRMIAISQGNTKIVENAFMAGLLHDLGKIILLSTDLSLTKKIAEIVKDRKISTTTVMEEISIGISHSTIGALIAQNWNFPEFLVEAIRCHHAPLNAKKEFSEVVNVVYLANILCGIEERKYNYYYIDEEILDSAGLLETSKFEDFHQKLINKYNNTKNL
ncbi:MAG: HDOD domain-containing protein [Spirochaetes bacterium]|jgi:putative nucleotidyltransferase with HDIG domain|nr:HDOD domain-containing protein [Spirochaetota bacterium]